MKQPKPMNRQMNLSFECGLPTCGIPTDLPLQQQEEIESALADLLMSVALDSQRIQNGGNDDR